MSSGTQKLPIELLWVSHQLPLGFTHLAVLTGSLFGAPRVLTGHRSQCRGRYSQPPRHWGRYWAPPHHWGRYSAPPPPHVTLAGPIPPGSPRHVTLRAVQSPLRRPACPWTRSHSLPRAPAALWLPLAGVPHGRFCSRVRGSHLPPPGPMLPADSTARRPSWHRILRGTAPPAAGLGAWIPRPMSPRLRARLANEAAECASPHGARRAVTLPGRFRPPAGCLAGRCSRIS